MNLQTVITNLKNTIAGKEEALALYESRQDIPRAPGDQMAIVATIEFLKVNINELKRILQDLELCAKQASDDSWITNPDRMGGGGWTQDELDPNRGWK